MATLCKPHGMARPFWVSDLTVWLSCPSAKKPRFLLSSKIFEKYLRLPHQLKAEFLKDTAVPSNQVPDIPLCLRRLPPRNLQVVVSLLERESLRQHQPLTPLIPPSMVVLRSRGGSRIEDEYSEKVFRALLNDSSPATGTNSMMAAKGLRTKLTLS